MICSDAKKILANMLFCSKMNFSCWILCLRDSIRKRRHVSHGSNFWQSLQILRAAKQWSFAETRKVLNQRISLFCCRSSQPPGRQNIFSSHPVISYQNMNKVIFLMLGILLSAEFWLLENSYFMILVYWIFEWKISPPPKCSPKCQCMGFE